MTNRTMKGGIGRLAAVALCAAACMAAWNAGAAAAGGVPASAFYASDPQIHTDRAAGVYRLYLQRFVDGGARDGVEMRTSRDLVTWSEPKVVLQVPSNRNCQAVWAPEMHKYGDAYYMFLTERGNDLPKGQEAFKPMGPKGWRPEARFMRNTLRCQTYRSASPEGPFAPLSAESITPVDWRALDGTLFVEDGRPYMVFCHEWTQTCDGTIDAVELSADLSRAVGSPFTLLKGSDFVNKVDPPKDPARVRQTVTDGPWFHRSKSGALFMLWATGARVDGRSGYVEVASRSQSGTLRGPWTDHTAIFARDGGHAAIFDLLEGGKAIALHAPNTWPDKRMHVFRLVDNGDSLALGEEIGKKSASSPLVTDGLEKTDLNGLWDFRFEKGKSLEDLSGLPAFEPCDKMTVPGCWNAMSRYYNQHGTGLYRTSFTLEGDAANAFLVVDGVGLRSRYWLDGREIGFSKLPWSKFEFATGALKAGRHELVAAVDSIVDNSKVKLFWDFYDFYPFGGFHHGVSLNVQRKAVELCRVVVRTRDYRTGRVELEAQFVGADAPKDFTADVAFDGAAPAAVAFRDRRATLDVPAFRLWSPTAPNLHVVSVRTAGGRAVSQRFGVRQVGTAKGRITLNGEPVYLKGVNRHESHYEFGVTSPVQLMYEDIQNLKDLGGNFIRGSHYAQSGKFLDLCDELGVLVWEESLGWGNARRQLADPEFRDLQEEETRLMVRNSINHPCVIISAFLNEPNSTIRECRTLVDRLVDVVRAEDSGHLVTFACNHSLKDVSHVKTDIIAYNTYPCWYSHELETGSSEEMRANIRKCHDEIVKAFRDKYKDDRPIVVSETGVKADYGARDPRGLAQYTEDFQAEYEGIMLEEMFAIKDIAGVAIWQFTDAKTYTRTRGLRNRSYGVNTGGLYDLYRRPKMVVDVVRRLFRAKSERD